MKIKQTIFAILAIPILCVFGMSQSVFAEKCGDVDLETGQKCCDGVVTTTIECDPTGTGIEGTGVWELLLMAVNIMSAGVGILAIGGIVYAAILYTSSGDKPEQAKRAIEMVVNVVIGIVLYALMFSLLNFLIPGGFLNK